MTIVQIVTPTPMTNGEKIAISPGEGTIGPHLPSFASALFLLWDALLHSALGHSPFVRLNLRELCIKLRQKDLKAMVTLELSNETSPGVGRPICAFERSGGGKFLDHELQ